MSAHTERGSASLVLSAAMRARAGWNGDVPEDEEAVGGERNHDIPLEAPRWEYFPWVPIYVCCWKLR